MALNMLSLRVGYLAGSRLPLSADVGVVFGDRCTWIFDVGNGDAAVSQIAALKMPRQIVLSHFHQDHAGNLDRIPCAGLYCGDYTRVRLDRGTAVTRAMDVEDGVRLRLFPLPSLHSKGAVGMMVDGTFAFLGDAVYGAPKGGRMAYNANALKDMIAALEALHAGTFLISHAEPYACPRDRVINGLKEIYRRRRPGEAWLYADERSGQA